MAPSQSARRSATADVRPSGVPGIASAKDPSKVEAPEPGYAIAYRIDQRALQTESAAEPIRVPAPLDRLPWEFAKDEFGSQRADFIGVMGALMVRTAKDSSGPICLIPRWFPGYFPDCRERGDRRWGAT